MSFCFCRVYLLPFHLGYLAHHQHLGDLDVPARTIRFNVLFYYKYKLLTAELVREFNDCVSPSSLADRAAPVVRLDMSPDTANKCKQTNQICSS